MCVCVCMCIFVVRVCMIQLFDLELFFCSNVYFTYMISNVII